MDDTERLDGVFTRTLGLPAGARLDDLAYGELAEWDSIGHLQLVAEIERAFGISLAAADVVEMTDYRSTRQVLRSNYALDC
jgi:acyl carrier protein